MNAPAPAAGGAPDMRVQIPALLHAAARLQHEADDLNRFMTAGLLATGKPCGSDPISGPALVGFREKITAIHQEVNAHITNLSAMASHLTNTAKSYGATEDDVTKSLDLVHSQLHVQALEATNPATKLLDPGGILSGIPNPPKPTGPPLAPPLLATPLAQPAAAPPAAPPPPAGPQAQPPPIPGLDGRPR